MTGNRLYSIISPRFAPALTEALARLAGQEKEEAYDVEPNQEVLFQQLETLAQGFAQLGARISQTAKELQSEATAFSEELAEEIATSCQDFTEPCARALELAESLIEPLLRVVAEAEEKRVQVEQVRQKALHLLDRVLAISHRDRPNYPPLAECQARARELRRTVMETTGPEFPPEIKALADHEHPLAALVTLVERLEDLDDERWEALQETVSQALGSSLAAAASRGKLVLSANEAEENVDGSAYQEAEL